MLFIFLLFSTSFNLRSIVGWKILLKNVFFRKFNLLNKNYFLAYKYIQLIFIYLLSIHLAMSSSFGKYILSKEVECLKLAVTAWFLDLFRCLSCQTIQGEFLGLMNLMSPSTHEILLSTIISNFFTQAHIAFFY